MAQVTDVNGAPDDLSLRPWQTDDVEFLASLMEDAEVRRFLGGPVARDEALRRARRLTEDVPWGYFVVEATGDPVGTVTFDRKRGPWEVSFQLAHDSWGRGLMAEALVEAVAWFRAQQPGEQLIAVTQVRNTAARRTIERSGGVPESEFEQYGEQQVQYVL
jgi:RimJ/RimL family protein N-acetyltransferase